MNDHEKICKYKITRQHLIYLSAALKQKYYSIDEEEEDKTQVVKMNTVLKKWLSGIQTNGKDYSYFDNLGSDEVDDLKQKVNEIDEQKSQDFNENAKKLYDKANEIYGQYNNNKVVYEKFLKHMSNYTD